MASLLSRRLCRSILTNPLRTPSSLSKPFCTDLSSPETSSDSEADNCPESDPLSPPSSSLDPPRTPFTDRRLENGLDVGIYRALLVGQVGQRPLQKKLKNGKTVTLMSLGTGGIRNNGRPLDNEEPRDYANRSAVQWHRVSIYPERLGDVAMKHVVPGFLISRIDYVICSICA
ncbi:hypothetical protein RJ639_044390 [Escallonia herrerae]|uniref:Single-stranded DNA-binding protein n=1 Tax=Escallonia herrerae TaxID=1293975 RepID=A0AA89B1P3_9ASTE|nr:hypothetical protein RJ639_044390 [Escallonia herrerae]